MNSRQVYDQWVNSPLISDEERAELLSMDEAEIYEAFYKYAEFGTGGMRGKMGLGTNRLNRYMVRMAAKAMADMLPDGGSAVIAFDTRNNSKEFAEETAKVMAAAGVKVYLFDRYSPVPLLSYAVRTLGADGGVVITASHNTKEYNGFKAYDETGCQMLPDKASLIAENMAKMDDPFAIPTADSIEASERITLIGEDIAAGFENDIAGCGLEESTRAEQEAICKDLKVVYTSIHGSGRDYVLQTLQQAGFEHVEITEGQAQFDGNFPTVTKPNPEDPQALSMAADKAISEGADIIIGTDPDCDRVGAGVVVTDEKTGERRVEYLTGNQMGALLINYLCQIRKDAGSTDDGTLITTIVTGAMGPIVAADHGIQVKYVLTGFKYIGDIMNSMEAENRLNEYFMGYEESYGYLTGTHARDKDGVSSALVICRMAAYYKAKGKNLIDVMNELYDTYGYWKDAQQSLVYEGAEGEAQMKEIMASLRDKKAGIFSELTEEEIKYQDYENEGTGLPKADVLKYTFADGSWTAIRPSGTEPKIKIYYCMCGKDKNAADERTKAVSAHLAGHMGA